MLGAGSVDFIFQPLPSKTPSTFPRKFGFPDLIQKGFKSWFLKAKAQLKAALERPAVPGVEGACLQVKLSR